MSVLLSDIGELYMDFMQDGGPFMIVILGVFIIGVLISVERLVFLSRCKRSNDGLILEVEKSDSDLNYVISNSNATLAKLWQPVFKKDTTFIDEATLAESKSLYLKYSHVIGKRTQFIAVLANIATLLGLLGTIVGLISSFSSISSVSAAEKSEVLSSSISMAMNTTAGGLLVAIPLLLLHYGLQSKVRSIDSQCEAFNTLLSGKIRSR